MAEPLTLKVMRLRRPQAEAPCVLPGEDMGDSPKLLLPMSLTQSLVGEPFTGYLHLANHGSGPVEQVTLKVELQIGALRFVLFDNTTAPVEAIPANDFFDTDVEHQLNDAGTYVLTCNVSYVIPGQALPEPTTFKRSYRFPALQPFAVVHRVAQLDTQLLVECVVENTTTGSIYLTSSELRCEDEDFQATLLDDGASPGKEGGSSGMRLLRPRGAHCLVFRAAPKSPSDMGRVSAMSTVGSLSLGWRVPDGPSGCTVGSPIRVKPAAAPELDLRVVGCPSKISVEVPFQVEVEVVNRTGKAAEPVLLFDLSEMAAVKVHGATQLAVGRVEAQGTARLSLDLLVTLPGLHPLRGISLADANAPTKSDFGAICELLVF